MYELKDDAFFSLLENYPACEVDYFILKNETPYNGEESHLEAVSYAMRKLSFPEGESEPIWDYDTRYAMAAPIDPEDLFYLPSDRGTDVTLYGVDTGGEIPYWQAFMMPPHGFCGTEDDFIKLNATLFPNGFDALSVYDWTTDWAEYFEMGREWWGALCVSVYDKSLDRYVVITASSTD